MENLEDETGKISSRIKVISDDITKLDVDAIVNAANRSLLGGGGVDGAIHRAAGRELLEYCKTLNSCETGEAKISPGFLLPSRYVIHTVGPVWHGGKSNEPLLLANAYRNSLQIASDRKFKIIAFPNISTGVYGFPKRQAAEIAFRIVEDFLSEHEFPEEVWFVIFDRENFDIYKKMLSS